ncbi:hypothetical protein GP486_006585 [Trichoglossum hirsutum]|uniref:Transcriptional adapter 2 n=1 Tax=Trichoglossum hirsutum TaxID=265104 RepID=A0A9P8L7D4_9PEZI|nr:hypothetical protein GP486_006585 [Trichoglossum hirsutum]
MGVIKKKTATRGTEGGVKFVCDVCSADITSTVRIRCAHPACTEYDLCVPCFSNGASSGSHYPPTHQYQVIEQHSIPIFTEDWGADEELLLLEGAESYGLGSWAEIANHIGGYRTKEEVRDHYINTYINSPNFPLPELASPKNTGGLDKISREDFQARKKRRIEDRREAAKNLPPATPKKKPTASVPACHEVQGYMPGRLEFETEYANDAEEAVQHMQFDPGDGVDLRTGELEPEMKLKLTVMDIYNSRLTARAERKKAIFEHKLLEYRKNAALDRKRTKEEKDLLNKAKPFARMMNHQDFEDFCNGLVDELNLRQAIAQLQEWRQMRIGDLRSGERYEAEKAQRANAMKPQPTGQFDRLASARQPKSTPPVEIPSAAAALTAPELPHSIIQSGVHTPSSISPPSRSPHAGGDVGKALANGSVNGTVTPSTNAKQRFVIQPLANVQPLTLNNENATDLHLLTKEEQQLCSILRIMPKPYLVMKEHIIKEAMKQGGNLKKKTARDICRIDVNKGSRIYDFFVNSGWIGKA